MSDMGIPYDTNKAIQGMAEGYPKLLECIHDPGRKGVPEAQQAHACATTSKIDPPVELASGHHRHHHDILRSADKP